MESNIMTKATSTSEREAGEQEELAIGPRVCRTADSARNSYRSKTAQLALRMQLRSSAALWGEARWRERAASVT